MHRPKIVVIGGGSGTFELLTGLKRLTPNLTAVVGMADDGGSTGVLRDAYDVLPPGDVRKALVALANIPEMRDLFDYRYRDGDLAGHTFGNLFLSTVEKMPDSNFDAAVRLASKLLNVTGRVVPVTLDNVRLVIKEENGHITRGEHQIDKHVFFTQRPHIELEPAATITSEARAAILDADMIVIAPGSLYGSLAAVLIVGGVAEALQKTKAQKIYVCNLVIEPGQTDGFAVHDYAAEIERFLGGSVYLDYVLYNNRKPSREGLPAWITYDPEVLAHQHYTAIGSDFVYRSPVNNKTLIRHNSTKIAATILDLHIHDRVRA